MSITGEDVQDILRIIDDMEVDRLHVRTGRFELSLRRGDDGEWTQSARTTAQPVLVDDRAAREQPAPGGATPADRAAPAREGLTEVRTPLPGAFYRAPKPGAPPFVEIGDEVTETTVVGIVETMKLMNSVYAGAAGTVADIRLGDGDFTEQGTVLMFIDTQAGGTAS
ncbi:acetyl-CoA carboxylase biotin carboxyl carrier protein [Streptomyces sp. DSM 40750]|uniref:acetyl-CoA carboxylase biotin carboxyl carrier protein n=1 Tax=Streptomyces sp. DSM 40750 TaxID=2801030 RepID=UPI00214AE648|nr:biotin/lipoyl-containing protein [Streptomyces sp. DSM 40750]UUU19112.1 acetyl-CoA carboxylase biotin carboxyl carrier protein subunit [Streptomyces sp. DSM 40750]UUU27544.1 acetyl-CoA carboxylase biotin carboxyl carrier protein subunit [Streptomyces sp. DSM 40750]